MRQRQRHVSPLPEQEACPTDESDDIADDRYREVFDVLFFDFCHSFIIDGQIFNFKSAHRVRKE